MERKVQFSIVILLCSMLWGSSQAQQKFIKAEHKKNPKKQIKIPLTQDKVFIVYKDLLTLNLGN
jgi:hypothetical protein